MGNWGWEKVGSVGVDSGQVMLVDPCYLDKWDPSNDKTVVPLTYLEHKETKKRYACSIHAVEQERIREELGITEFFANWGAVIEDCGMSANDLVAKKLVEQRRHNMVPEGEFSYAGACHATLRDEGCGEIGLGFVTSTLIGDGCYPVFIKRDGEGGIAQIKIDFEQMA